MADYEEDSSSSSNSNKKYYFLLEFHSKSMTRIVLRSCIFLVYLTFS